jgi:hypothetical protein
LSSGQGAHGDSGSVFTGPGAVAGARSYQGTHHERPARPKLSDAGWSEVRDELKRNPAAVEQDLGRTLNPVEFDAASDQA